MRPELVDDDRGDVGVAQDPADGVRTEHGGRIATRHHELAAQTGLELGERDLQRDVRRDAVSAVMGRSPKTIGPDELASAAVHAMESHKVNALVVVDVERRVVGALNFIDLLRARVV